MKLIRSFSLILSIGTLLFLNSCAEKNGVSSAEKPSKEVSNQVGQDVVALEQRTVTGSFKSVKGVADDLSCYTKNGGYVTVLTGEIVAVSFNDSEAVSSCDNITVTGYKTSRSIKSKGSCPEGMMAFLKVQSYTVGATDY